METLLPEPRWSARWRDISPHLHTSGGRWTEISLPRHTSGGHWTEIWPKLCLLNRYRPLRGRTFRSRYTHQEVGGRKFRSLKRCRQRKGLREGARGTIFVPTKAPRVKQSQIPENSGTRGMPSGAINTDARRQIKTFRRDGASKRFKTRHVSGSDVYRCPEAFRGVRRKQVDHISGLILEHFCA